MATTEQKIDKILSYIENDPTTGRKGVYSMLQDMEERIETIETRVLKLEDAEDKRSWLMAKVGAVSAGIGTFVTWIVTKWDDIASVTTRL